MGLTKREIFTEQQNRIAVLAKAFGHPARVAILQHLFKMDACICGDLEIEVEYQAGTIGKFGLDFDGKNFLLTNKQTDCLAKDQRGVPSEKTKVKLSDLNAEPCCAPDGNCC